MSSASTGKKRAPVQKAPVQKAPMASVVPHAPFMYAGPGGQPMMMGGYQPHAVMIGGQLVTVMAPQTMFQPMVMGQMAGVAGFPTTSGACSMSEPQLSIAMATVANPTLPQAHVPLVHPTAP